MCVKNQPESALTIERNVTCNLLSGEASQTDENSMLSNYTEVERPTGRKRRNIWDLFTGELCRSSETIAMYCTRTRKPEYAI